MIFEEYIVEVKEYYNKGASIYIYGAGKVGVKLLSAIRDEGVVPDAFIVTEAQDNPESKEGVPVIQYNDNNVDKNNSLVLVALKKPWNQDVITLLNQEGFPHVLDMLDDFDKFVRKPMILEITVRIGCKIACHYCPQKLLISKYRDREKVLSFSTFKKAVDKLPRELGVAFSGFAEPFLNPDVVSMICYADQKKRDIYLNTTLVGLTKEKFEVIRNIPFKQNILHLPDMHGYANIPVNEEYLELLDIVLNAKRKNGEPFFDKANAQGDIDPVVKKIVKNRILVSSQLVDRAGNLPQNTALKTAPYLNGKVYCNCSPEMNAHVLMPNGDLALCCMDFGLDYIIGNLLHEDYESIQNGEKMQYIRSLMAESPRGGDVICRKCTEAIQV